MKILQFPIQKAVSIAVLSAAMIALSAPVRAQTSLTPELQTEAEQACIESARVKGFELDEVVSVAPADGDTVQVVLNLLREGQLYKLTCGYSTADRSAVVGEDAPGNAGAADTSTTAPSTTQTYQSFNPWLGLLIPLIGLPLLLLWARGRRSDEYVRYTSGDYDRVIYGERSEAIVRSNDELVNVYSGPGSTYRVTDTLRHGQRIVLSGRYDSDWLELEKGGWVPARYIETATRYAR